MIFKNHKIQKRVSFFIIILMLMPALLFFSVPQKTQAFLGFGDIVFDVPTEISVLREVIQGVKKALKVAADQLLKSIAKKALAQMTKSTVNWINTGFHGAPLFLENPQSFFNDIAKSEIKNLINIIGYDPVRFPFGKQFALNTIDAYKRQLSDNASYSLSNVVNDPTLLTNYRNNFSYGGWNGLILHTQYPQNNYIGSRIQINDELGRRIAGTIKAPAQKVQETLQQGLGFLSPQTCLSNPSYNNDYNEFNRPSYKPTIDFNPPEVVYDEFGPINQAEYDAYETNYKQQVASEKAAWAETNVCPGGLTNTTPGSVVSNEIMTSLTSGKRLTELQSALGGSLSAIFDALLNKFLGDGLNTLASKVNPQPPADNWDYYGNTLGSPSTDSRDVFSGPDQEVILDEFKKAISGRTIIKDATGAVIKEEIGNTGNGDYLPGGIANTEAELVLMDNISPDNLGITQFFALSWPKMRELDICLPGPDLGWETRLDEERDRNSKKFQEKLSDSNGETAAKAQLADKELKFAVESFKDWIKTKMITELPGGIIYMDAVAEIEDFVTQAKDLTDKRKGKAQALARLKAIELSLVSFTTQPAPGTQEEKDLVAIRKQYDAIFPSISNVFSIEETRAELDIAKDRFINLNKLVGQCTTERTQKGWTTPTGNWGDTLINGFKSILTSAVGKPFVIRTQKFTLRGLTTGEEKEQFCTIPIANGYTHGPFKNPNPVPIEYKDLPLVNAVDVSYKNSGFFSSGTISIAISCNIIYRANIVDYKGSIFTSPTLPEPIQPPPLPDDTGDTDSGLPPTTDPELPPTGGDGTLF